MSILLLQEKKRKKREKVKKFVQAYQSDEVDKVATEVFKGGAVKGW